MAWITRRPIGLTLHDDARALDGYVLVASARGHHALLIDLRGQVVHDWFHPEGIQHLRMLDTGNLLVHTLPPDDADGAEHIGGNAGALVELDWESNVVWEYRDRFLHHDYQRLADGSHLAIAWSRMPAGVKKQVRGGHDHADDPEWMWGDVIKRIMPDGTATEVWRSWEHLSFEDHVICPLESRREWTHTNSLEVMPDGRWLLSFRLTSTIVIVNPETGAVEWSWGGPELVSHQHHAQCLEDGHILLFDNGAHRRRAPSFSQVVELDPNTNEVVWRYLAPTIVAFFSFMVSGAVRLPNGNTFITEGASGRLFEVTPSGRTVWEWITPWIVPSSFGPTPITFRAYKLGADDPRLIGHDLSPKRFSRVNDLIAAGTVLGAADDLAPLADGVG